MNKNIYDELENLFDEIVNGDDPEAAEAKEKLFNYVNHDTKMVDWLNFRLDSYVNCMLSMDWITATCIKNRIIMSLENYINA